MPERKVEYIITADSKRAEQSFQKLENQASKLKSTILSMAGKYISFTAVLGIATKSLQEFSESQARELRLQQTLINTRNYSIQQYQELIKYTKQLQNELAIEDDRAIDLLQTLAGFGTPAHLLKDLAQATIELSTFLGIDLNSAAMLVGKTMEGTVNPLRRYGIEVKNAKDETERATIIINQAIRRWGGLTKATMSGVKGDWERFKYDIANIMESVGGFIVSGFYGVYNTFDLIFHTLTFRLDDWLKSYRKKWQDIAKAMAIETEKTLISTAFQDARKIAIGFDEKKIKEAIQWYESEIKHLDATLNIMTTHRGQEEKDNIIKQIKLLTEEKRAYEEILETRKTLNKESKNADDLLIAELDKIKTKISLKEIETELYNKTFNELLKTYKLSLEQINILEKSTKEEKTRLEILREKLELTKKISEIEQYLLRGAISEILINKSVGINLEKKVKQAIENGFNKVDVPEIPAIENQLSDMEIAWRNTWYDVIWYIGNEFEKMWEKTFGEANSLLEVFTQSLMRQLVDIAAKFTITTILSTLGIPLPVFHSGGVVKKAHSGIIARDEVPIIAKKGEMVLTEQQQYNLFELLKGNSKQNLQQNIYLIVDGEKITEKIINKRIPKIINKLDYVLR